MVDFRTQPGAHFNRKNDYTHKSAKTLLFGCSRAQSTNSSRSCLSWSNSAWMMSWKLRLLLWACMRVDFESEFDCWRNWRGSQACSKVTYSQSCRTAWCWERSHPVYWFPSNRPRTARLGSSYLPRGEKSQVQAIMQTKCGSTPARNTASPH